jgi:4-carboxymuconolactone decarboxylase
MDAKYPSALILPVRVAGASGSEDSQQRGKPMTHDTNSRSDASSRGRVRPQAPRIPPLTPETATPPQQAVLAGLVRSGQIYNVFGTMANHPDLARDWLVFASHVLSRNTLPPRDREILILRIGWLCQAEYEWAQHVRIGKKTGLTDADIEHIRLGPSAPGVSEHNRLLLQATDELHADACISEPTWQSLSKVYDQNQRMDLVFTVGQYNLVSMALNSFGVQLDKGLEGFPKAATDR